jgi:hypothetical protein
MGEGLKRARAAAWASRNLGDGHPTPSGITGLLVDTGFTRAGRGSNATASGFEVSRFGTLGGFVTVWHRASVKDEDDTDSDVWLTEYAAVIEAAGYKARRDDRVDRLIVTSREGGS